MGENTTDHFLLIGISHKTAPIAVRERFSFGTDVIPPLFDVLTGDERAGVEECVLLSTCNRTELYTVVSSPAGDAKDRIMDIILDYTGQRDEMRGYFYTLTGRAVIEHLYTVVAGIDSMILGEPQIFGQVKSAYALACDCECTGPMMNRLFHRSFQAGKEVRNRTSIGEGATSIGSAAVALAQKTIGSLGSAVILLVGAGKIGEICAKQLACSGARRFYLMNRTHERAVGLTKRLDGTALPFDRLGDVLGEADIVISSVASREPIITTSLIEDVLPGRGGRPLVLIDLGVPRTVEPAVGGCEGMTLFNIDDLIGVIQDNRDRRLGEAARARGIIEREVENYVAWLSEREVVPVINDLRKKCEAIRLAELERIRNKVDPDTYRTLEVVTRRIIRKILHNPTVRVRSSESGEFRKQLIESLNELFISDAD